MRPKTCLLLTIVCAIAIVVVFISFMNMMIRMDFGTSVSDIIISIFAHIGTIALLMFMMVMFLLKYIVSKKISQSAHPMKACVSCGQAMEITEMSCPRCFALQPIDNHGKRL